MGTSSKDKNLVYFPSQGLIKSDIIRKGKVKLTLNDEEIALLPHGENVFAVQDKCPHSGGPIHEGDIEDLPDSGLCIRCPWHSWKFHLKTGECVSPYGQVDKKLRIYPVHVDSKDRLRVGFPKNPPKGN